MLFITGQLSSSLCCRLDATKNAILPELVELANDEESFVRLAGLETVVNVLSLLDDGKDRVNTTFKRSIAFPFGINTREHPSL